MLTLEKNESTGSDLFALARTFQGLSIGAQNGPYKGTQVEMNRPLEAAGGDLVLTQKVIALQMSGSDQGN